MDKRQRPFVHINCATTVDGRLARGGGERIVLSSPWDKRRVHRLRERYGAVLVGVRTLLLDDPKLHINPGYTGGEATPLTRVILDSTLRTPPEARLFSYPGDVIIYHSPGVEKKESLLRRGVSLVEVPREGEVLDLKEVLRDLKGRGVDEVLVEGGGRVIGSFLREGLFDIFTLFVSPLVIGDESAPTILTPGAPIRLKLEGAEVVEGGVLLTLRPGD